MNTTPHIFVLGSFVVGVTIRVQRPPARGETLLGDAFDLGPGGKGTNQAIAIARQGGRVSLLACVGKDRFASLARELLEAEGLAPTWLHELEAVNTGIGFVTLLPDGENTIVLHPGANACMTLEMVDGAAETLASAAVVLAQLEVPVAVAEHALAQGRAEGALTILNPAPGRLLPRSLLAQVDILTPNETEARLLLGAPPDADMPVEDLAENALRWSYAACYRAFQRLRHSIGSLQSHGQRGAASGPVIRSHPIHSGFSRLALRGLD
jgi:ribokinase